MSTMQQQQQQQQPHLLVNSDSKDNDSLSLTIPSPSSSSEVAPISLLPLTANIPGLRHWQSQPLLRTKASTQLSPFHAQSCHSTQSHALSHHCKTTGLDVSRQSHTSSIAHAAAKTHSFSEWNRTQHKLMLQRQSFLANDKHHLDYPANMKRLTKEMDRMNHEYRCVRHYEDPMTESFLRVTMSAYHHYPITSPQFSSLSSSTSSTSSSLSSTDLLDAALSTTHNICNNSSNSQHHHPRLYYHQQQHQPFGKVASPRLQRRASDFMLKHQDRRNSSTSIHSAIIERSHQPPSASSSSKNYFFIRWFKPSLPPIKRHQLHPTC